MSYHHVLDSQNVEKTYEGNISKIILLEKYSFHSSYSYTYCPILHWYENSIFLTAKISLYDYLLFFIYSILSVHSRGLCMWVYLFFSRHIGNLQGHFCGIFTREDEILYDIKFSIKWFLIIFIKNIRDFKMIMNNSIAVNFLSIFEWFRMSSPLNLILKKRLLTKYKSGKFVNIRNHRVFRFGYRTFMNLRLCVFSPKKDFHVHRL